MRRKNFLELDQNLSYEYELMIKIHIYIYIDMLSGSLTERAQSNNTLQLVICILRARFQLLKFLNITFHKKDNNNLLRQKDDFRAERADIQGDFETFCYSVKEVLKTDRGMSKDIEASSRRLSLAKIRDNLNIKMNNYRN